jgi:hypothetical protein
MTPAHRTERCRVCGSSSLRTDEVVHVGRWLLAECERCQYRWTAELTDRPRSRGARRSPVAAVARTEVARAA